MYLSSFYTKVIIIWVYFFFSPNINFSPKASFNSCFQETLRYFLIKWLDPDIFEMHNVEGE